MTKIAFFQFLIKGYLLHAPRATTTTKSFNSSLKDTLCVQLALTVKGFFQFLIKGYKPEATTGKTAFAHLSIPH